MPPKPRSCLPNDNTTNRAVAPAPAAAAAAAAADKDVTTTVDGGMEQLATCGRIQEGGKEGREGAGRDQEMPMFCRHRSLVARLLLLNADAAAERSQRTVYIQRLVRSGLV